MTLSQIAQILKARWRTIFLSMLAVTAAGAAVTALLPRQYTAAASVVLDVKSTDPIAGFAMQPLGITSYMATQSDIIASERVIMGALRELKLDTDPEMLARWAEATARRGANPVNAGNGDFLRWLAEQTRKKFKVLPSRESNVLTVTHTDPAPERAAAVVNAIVNSYIATTVELRAEPARQYNRFFDSRARELRESLEQAQARLSNFQRAAGVLATDERLDIENTRLSDLSTQLVQAQAAAVESGSRRNLAASNPDRAPEVLASPMISGLSADLAQKEAHLKELQSRYAEAHPQMVALRANIGEIRQRIEAETARVLGGLAVTDRVNEARILQLRTQLEAQRSKVLALKAQRDRAAVLQRDVENANQAYNAAYTQASQTDLQSQATQTNVSILRTAVPPLDPSRPRVLTNIAVSLILGALLGMAFAAMREMRDQRLRSDDDVEALLGVPLLGSMPGPSALRKLSGPGRPRSRRLLRPGYGASPAIGGLADIP